MIIGSIIAIVRRHEGMMLMFMGIKSQQVLLHYRVNKATRRFFNEVTFLPTPGRLFDKADAPFEIHFTGH